MSAPVKELRPEQAPEQARPAPVSAARNRPTMRDAVVWAEIIGRPKALRRKQR